MAKPTQEVWEAITGFLAPSATAIDGETKLRDVLSMMLGLCSTSIELQDLDPRLRDHWQTLEELVVACPDTAQRSYAKCQITQQLQWLGWWRLGGREGGRDDTTVAQLREH